EDLVSALLLPAFFALTGLRTRVTDLDDVRTWLVCALVLAVATAGKVGGAFAASRVMRLGWRDGLRLGVLMNTRGLMGLIVLNIGLEMGVLRASGFSVMVDMLSVTTAMTGPIIHALDGASAAPGSTEDRSRGGG